MAHKGDWVRISSIVLASGERAPQVPEDTAKTPLTQWVKGWLLADAGIGSPARVRTRTGREVEGVLLEASPLFEHSFGEFIPELQRAQEGIRRAMWGEGAEE